MSTAPSVACGFSFAAVDPRAALRFAQARDRIDMDAGERVGVLVGDGLDLHTTLRGEHPEMLLGAAIERERRVVLLRDVGRVLDPDHVHDVALDVEAEDVAGVEPRFVRVLGELHPTGLAPAAHLDLGLDDDRIADALGRGDRVVDVVDCNTGRHGDPVPREQLLALVFEQIHRCSSKNGGCTGWEAIARAAVRASRAPIRATR